MQLLPNSQSQSSSKRFDRKALVGILFTAGLVGLFLFLVYRPLLTWKLTTLQVLTDVRDTIYFDVASTTIKPEAYSVLENIVKNNAGLIIIIGGADSTGKILDNWKLAQARSQVVREMLINLRVKVKVFDDFNPEMLIADSSTVIKSINPDWIVAIGYGDRRPLVPNNKQTLQFNRYTIIQWRRLQ